MQGFDPKQLTELERERLAHHGTRRALFQSQVAIAELANQDNNESEARLIATIRGRIASEAAAADEKAKADAKAAREAKRKPALANADVVKLGQAGPRAAAA